MNDQMMDDFEAELADLMLERANKARVVPPDQHTVPVLLDRDRVTTPRHSDRFRLLSVAAALVAVVALGALAIRIGTGEVATTNPSIDDDPAAETDDVIWREAVIWLPNDATSQAAAAVAVVLSDLPSVKEVRYVDGRETYAEFEAYFEDMPEILSAVGPEDLPTSFRLLTTGTADDLYLALDTLGINLRIDSQNSMLDPLPTVSNQLRPAELQRLFTSDGEETVTKVTYHDGGAVTIAIDSPRYPKANLELHVVPGRYAEPPASFAPQPVSLRDRTGIVVHPPDGSISLLWQEELEVAMELSAAGDTPNDDLPAIEYLLDIAERVIDVDDEDWKFFRP